MAAADPPPTSDSSRVRDTARHSILRQTVPFVLLPLLLTLTVGWIAWQNDRWTLEHEERSEYSHIRVRRHGDLRALLFVRDSGREVTETRIDLSAPHELQLPYARGMFASYLATPNPSSVLIVGLGGGAMVHFLEHHEPQVRVDAVEIDPVVVRLADEMFDVRPRGGVRIFTEDAFDYLERCKETYDVIYMDAFLRPSYQGTDGAGVPERLRTLQFYASLRERLSDIGCVTFNLTHHAGTESDIDTIVEAFPGSVVIDCPPSLNTIVVAPVNADNATDQQIIDRARAADERFETTFSFVDMLDHRREP